MSDAPTTGIYTLSLHDARPIFPLILAQEASLLVPMAAWPFVAVVAVTLYVGMYLYNKAYTFAPASIVSPVSYIGVVFSGFWGWVVWGHVPDSYAILGMLFIFTSLLISTRIARNKGDTPMKNQG